MSASLLLGLSAALARWGQPASPAAKIDLHADASSSNLNLTSAEVPARQAHGLRPVGFQRAQDEGARAVELPALEPMPPEPESPILTATPIPAELETTAADLIPAAVAQPDEEDLLTIPTPHQGDSPMMLNWKLLGLQTLLAGALSVAPAPALATEGPPNEPAKEDTIARQLKELKAAVDALMKLQKAQTDIEDLQKEVAQLRKDLDELRKHISSTQQVTKKSFSIQPNGAGTVRIQLLNSYIEEKTIIVNGKAYRLAPGETRLTEPLASGTITYEVLGVQPKRSLVLAANEPFTIEVYDRARR